MIKRNENMSKRWRKLTKKKMQMERISLIKMDRKIMQLNLMEKKFKNANQDRYKIRKSILKLKLKHLRKRTNKKHTKSFEISNRIPIVVIFVLP